MLGYTRRRWSMGSIMVAAMSVKLHREVGLVGFICPLNGDKVKLDEHCMKCQVECEPLPLLAAMLEGVRDVVMGVYSATELVKPRQCVYFERNFPYYTAPESNLWSVYGTALHTVIESGLDKNNTSLFKDRFIYEKRFDVQVGNATLRGTPDLYDTQTKTLWDWKTVKYYYTGKYLLEHKWEESTYREQLNIYRTFFFPEAEHLKLKLLVRDHNYRLRKDCPSPSPTVEVPIMDVGEVKDFVYRRVEESLQDQQTGSPPPCTEKEMWVRNGRAYRCEDYCGGKAYCQQCKTFKEANL